jgi:hypothetical protein
VSDFVEEHGMIELGFSDNVSAVALLGGTRGWSEERGTKKRWDLKQKLTAKSILTII